MDSITPVYDNSLRGKGISNAKFHGKIPNIIHLHLIKYIDTNNLKRKKVVFREILNWLRNEHAVYCSKHTLSQDMLDIGVPYKPRKPKICNNNVARIDQIREYFISLHDLLNL